MLGCEATYRVPWKKSTKLGGGILIALDQPDLFLGSEKVYGAVFADIAQFLGKRQRWSVDGRVGHGFYKEVYEIDDSLITGFTKWTAGMYYYTGLTYRVIVSKKVLITMSPYTFFRNFRQTSVADYHSPPSTNREKYVAHYSGFGFRVGVVF